MLLFKKHINYNKQIFFIKLVGAGGVSAPSAPTNNSVNVGSVGSVGVGVGSVGSGADMKRAYEALGIACPTSVAGMVGGFARAPLGRLPAPRAPPLPDVLPQQPMQQLFSHQPQPDLQQQQSQQQQQLVSKKYCVKYFFPLIE